jgi:energy-coupling factor transport system permease protein
MRPFESYNPIVLFLYFLAVGSIVMFTVNPLLVLIALVTMFVSSIVCVRRRSGKYYLYIFVIFVLTSAANPVFSHNGVTVLFVLNDNPVTLEAVLYGMEMGAMIAAVLMMMRLFLDVMTCDRLLYIIGSASPKFALLVSMTLRFIPLFGRQAAKVEDTQRTLGMYNDENAIDTIKGKLKVFSIMTTWGLENGIITADSMSARGYGTGRRTFYSPYRFRRTDAALLLVILALSGFVLVNAALGKLKFSFYPAMSGIPGGFGAVLSYVFYAVLCVIPLLIEIGEKVRWKLSESKI